jgi:transcriptional regulator with XRE-family HTH domain
MDIRLVLGRNVRERRKAAGMSQEDLAARTDVDQAYISRLEAGEKNPTILTLWHVAQALETTSAGLLQEPPED